MRTETETSSERGKGATRDRAQPKQETLPAAHQEDLRGCACLEYI